MIEMYLCDKPDQVQWVFGTKDPVYTKADLLSNPEKFREVQYVFSTWGMPKFTEEEIKTSLPALKAVFYAAGSVQSFAQPFLECGVKVFSAWGANAVPVAEYTVAQILLANKGFFRTMRYTDRKEARATFARFPGNYGAKVGLLGAGMIGKLVIERLKEYRLQVMVFDPFLPEKQAEQMGVKKASLEEIFAECAVVSNHLANNPQTRRMLTGELFSKMPENATFLNTGRGAQVVEEELIAVLKDRPDLVAILDVTEPEPPRADSELYTLPNCILTPHIAGSSGDEVCRMAEYMRQEFEALTNGRPTRYEVTEEMLKTMA